MRSPPTPLQSEAPRLLSMPFDSAWLRGMGSSERGIALARLASLLWRPPASRPESMTMTSADLLPAAVLKRKAVVYVRQSTQAQVQSNLESQRRQYELVDVARRRGFRDVEVIDDDLGRSASRMVARPVSSGWWLGSVLGKSGQCCASTPPVSPATAATGTTCSSSAAWSRRE